MTTEQLIENMREIANDLRTKYDKPTAAIVMNEFIRRFDTYTKD